MKHFNSPSNRRGFTLVEIMVVVLIVGILSVIAMFVLGKIKNVTAHSLLKNNLRQLYQAKEYYFLESGTGSPVTANELVAQNYLRSSQLYSLYQNGSMETHMGWVYDGTFYPKDPVAANLLPSGPSKTASTESIYYPGPPASGRNSAYAIFAAVHPARDPKAPPLLSTTPKRPPPITEDGSQTFTPAELLAMVGAVNPTGDKDGLSVTRVEVDPSQGTVTQGTSGAWTFTPAPNFHGTDIPFTIGVSNPNGETLSQTRLTVTPVTDPADIQMAITARQQVVTTGAAADLGRIQIDRIMNPPTSAMTLEFTVVGNAVPDTGASTGPVVVNIGTQSDNNLLSLWNPGDMKIGGAGDVATGINLGDGNSHRITLTWDSGTGDLKVFDNGELKTTVADWKKGASLPGDLYTVLGGKMNNPSGGDGFNQNEHYEGEIFNTALASMALSESEVKAAPLASQTKPGSGLVFDVRSINGNLVDTTGQHAVQTHGGLGHTVSDVDTAFGVTPPGSLLRMGLQTQPTDPSDRVTGVAVVGLHSGTVLSDGTHTQTVTDTEKPIDLTGWDTTQLTAQLPPAVNGNMRVDVIVTTTGADGTQTDAKQSKPLVLNPTAAVPAQRT